MDLQDILNHLLRSSHRDHLPVRHGGSHPDLITKCSFTRPTLSKGSLWPSLLVHITVFQILLNFKKDNLIMNVCLFQQDLVSMAGWWRCPTYNPFLWRRHQVLPPDLMGWEQTTVDHLLRAPVHSRIAASAESLVLCQGIYHASIAVLPDTSELSANKFLLKISFVLRPLVDLSLLRHVRKKGKHDNTINNFWSFRGAKM